MSKSVKELEQEFQVDEYERFFTIPGTMSKVCSQRGYAFSTVNKYFSQSPGFEDFKSRRRQLNYSRFEDAISWCKEAGLVPLFKRESWRGLVRWEDGKTICNQYQVRCPSCNSEYKTYFKSSLPHFSKCPYCKSQLPGTSRYSKFNFDTRVLEELKKRNLSLIDDKPLNNNDYFIVKCNTCGTEFSTTLKQGHFNNCPYCSQSHNKDNVLIKIQKLCAEYDYTFEDSYDSKNDGNKLKQYRVRCNRCKTLFETFINGHQMKLCPVCKQSDYRSSRERKICTLLDLFKVEYISNYRAQFVGGDHVQELDIYIPSKGIAFEFNGFYWHNSGTYEHSKSRCYHQQKTINCLNNGIKLYHIWEDVSDELCQSIVLSKLGLSKKLYARKYKVQEIDSQKGKEFFKTHHVDGNVRAVKYFALCDKDKILCCLSLNQRRIQSTGNLQWEIARFASAFNITVVGGYSKLLEYSKQYLLTLGVHTLISYCNKDLSPDYQSTVYSKLGFTFVCETSPIYRYWFSREVTYNGRVFKRGDITSRQTFQRQKLVKHYEDSGEPFPKDTSEFGLATNLGAMPCYNSGNLKYMLEF